MKQRKLTPAELRSVADARHHMRNVAQIDTGALAGAIVIELNNMATYGTNDGKPWVELLPEIGDGYREATLSDAHRRDRQVWCDGLWLNAQIGHTETNRVYSVPVDRIPTDEDAKQRPMVMVRDAHNHPWRPAKLYGVALGTAYPFLCERDSLSSVMLFCRFPYPGELD
jgi:hypothetical protein